MDTVTISFYSYKGGVGRSLALVNLGIYLAQFGASVVMIDFDLEAPGLHYKLRPGLDPPEIPNRGLAGLLADASAHTVPTALTYDIALDMTNVLREASSQEAELEPREGRLLLVPAGNPLSERYWQDLGCINWASLFVEGERPGLYCLSQLRRFLIDTYSPDVILVDSRTGITPSGGVATSLLPDVVVAFLLNTPEHIDGSRMVISTVLKDEDESGSEGGVRARVVPVLSRYTPASMAEPSNLSIARRRLGTPFVEQVPSAPLEDEADLLDGLWEALRGELEASEAARVARPLILHADLALQQQEQLAFGPSASRSADSASRPLLDDYLRLFASLVPSGMVAKFSEGVRQTVRKILLDRPGDALRSLENLAALAGDEAVFADLVKFYAIRRDTRGMLAAAERLFRVYRQVIVNPAVTGAIREALLRPSPERVVGAEFAESYFREAAVADVQFGAAVVRALADEGKEERAEALCEELLARSEDPTLLREIVQGLSRGGSAAERLAVKVASRHFAAGAATPDFLRAAAGAARLQRGKALSVMVCDAPAFDSLPADVAIDTLMVAGRVEQAGERLASSLASVDEDDPELERFGPSWEEITKRDPRVRSAVAERRPDVARRLDALAARHTRELRSRVYR